MTGPIKAVGAWVKGIEGGISEPLGRGRGEV